MGSPSGSTNRTNPSIDTTDRAGQTRIPRAPAQQFNNAVDAQQSGAGSPSTVRDTQSQLNALGYDTGGVDGVAGARTDAAIRAFQAANGLAVDGIAGPQTLAAMAKAKADAVHSAPPARSFADRQSDIDNIATASPAAAQAMRNELAADVENRVAEIDNDLQNLPSSSFSGYVRLDLQAERDELARLLPVEPLSTVPEDPQAKADARALAANDAGGDYDHIINPSTGSGYTDAEVRDLMALPEITDGSDRRNFIKAAELKNDPSILEDFDQRLDDYNNLKTAVAQTYDNRVNELMNQNGYDRTVAEDLASLEFQNSGLPTHALPGQAKGLNFENRSDGEVYTLPSDPNDLHNFEAGSPEYRQFKEAIGQKFDASVDEVVKNQGIDRAVAERLVAMQFSSSGVPAHALPDNVSGFDPIEVLQRQGDVFDTALSTANDDGSSGLIKNLNDLVGRNGPDGFTATSDIDAIVANPDQFDADVVATAIVLQNAINKPENEDFKAQFEKPSFWQQVKESDWLDPDTDSFVVNISRAISTNGVSLLGANEFHDRVVEEGPGVLRQVNNSLNELSIENQVRLAFTDRDQLIENYKSFGGGAVDFGVDTAKLGVGVIGLSNPAIAAQIHQHTGTNVYAETYSAITNGTTAYINGPDEFARNIVGYDQFVNDPYRWAGNQAPDIVLEILGTKGASKAARGARAVDAAGDTAQAGTRVLSRSQDLIDGLDAQLLRADIEDGVPIDFLQLPDGTHIKVKELADGGYDLSYPDGPPPPRAEDFRSPPAPRAEDFVSDAPPPSPRAEDFRFDAPPPPRAEDFQSSAPPPQDFYDDRYHQLDQQGHGPARHNPDVDVHARALWGIDPITGSPIEGLGKFGTDDGLGDPIAEYLHNAPRNATKFESKEALVDADMAARNSQTFREGVLAGASEIKVTLELEDALGPDYLEKVSGRQRVGSANQNPKGPQDDPGLGTIPLDLTDGNLVAVYLRNPDGFFQLETIHPVPKPKTAPTNGKLNVGGTGEAEGYTNLNPASDPSTVSPEHIPALVQGGFEDIAKLIERNSVSDLIANKLQYEDINWTEAANGAAVVVKPGGSLSINVWANAEQAQAVTDAFRAAGFQNVTLTPKDGGVATMITATR